MTMSDTQMVDCIEENAYSTNEIFVSNQDHFKFNPIYKNDKIVKCVINI